MAQNVLGEELASCSTDPMTGFYRDGCCNSGGGDIGIHVVCAVLTADFLKFSKSRGNDLTTPRPEHNFPGLSAGDRWCLCASRWREAFDAGVAPSVILASTHMTALEYVSLSDLQRYEYDDDDGSGDDEHLSDDSL